MAKHFALVRDGLVLNVWRDRPDVETALDVSPANAGALMECPAETQAGWGFDPGASAFKPPIIPPPSVRRLRRAEYFLVLRREDGDDEITVLGDVVDVALAQIETIRHAAKAPATPDWSEMLAKIGAVKAKLPKPGG